MNELNRPTEYRERSFDLPLPFRATREGFLAWKSHYFRQRALREIPAMPSWLMRYIETQAVWKGQDPGPFQDGLTDAQAEDFRLRIEHERKTGERLPRGSFRPW